MKKVNEHFGCREMNKEESPIHKDAIASALDAWKERYDTRMYGSCNVGLLH